MGLGLIDCTVGEELRLARVQAAIAVVIAVSGLIATPAHAADRVQLPIRIHIANFEGVPVATASFVDRQLERANAIFAPYEVRFVKTATLELAAPHAAMETRADRNALAAYAKPGAIDCFVVRSLRDVDEPGRMRQGVHWHSRSHSGAHYVILSASAGPDVLAHELGHYLGNPRHSDTPGNLMSYERGEPALPFLDTAQLRRMRRAIRGYLRRGELQQPSATAAASGDFQAND